MNKKELIKLRKEVKDLIDSGMKLPLVGMHLGKQGYGKKEIAEILEPWTKAREKHSKGKQDAEISLILGIVGLFILPFVLGFVALLIGIRAWVEDKESHPMAAIGMALGVIDLIGWAIITFARMGG